MSEVIRIKDQLRRSIEGEAWHGPSVLEILRDVGPELAMKRPIAKAHTIWEIVLHIISNQDLVRNRLKGDDSPHEPDIDWPQVTDGSEKAWDNCINEIRRSLNDVNAALSGIDDSMLDKPILPGYSSIYITLHGLVQHNLYHAGQIAVLKKA